MLPVLSGEWVTTVKGDNGVDGWDFGLGAILEDVEIDAQTSIFTLSTTPDTFDWRDHGIMTPVRNQGACGSCVAFGVIGAFEAVIAKEGDGMHDLSEAHLYFCNSRQCENGWQMSSALDYLRDTGVPDEPCFPYAPSNMPCNTCSDWEERVWKIKEWEHLSTDKERIKEALIRYGPLPAGMTIYQDFFAYDGGIYEHKSGDYRGGHIVVIVGYDENDDYWICKNSWRSGWGENGYFRIKFDECGIDDRVKYIVYEPRLIADADGPYDELVGEPIQFYGSADKGKLPYSWEWDFGDGSAPSILQNPTHTYDTKGVYSVTLSVTDDSANIATDSAVVFVWPNHIVNQPPFVNFSVIVTGKDASFYDESYDMDGDIVYWIWNFGDGNISFAQNPTHTYSTNGWYNVSLYVQDDDGASAIASMLINVNTPIIRPSIVYVDDNYYEGGINDGHTWGYDAFAKIQDGVDGVAYWGQILVYNGVYSENIVINKPVSLYGENKETTIIDGSTSGNVITIDNTGWVRIEDFSVRNGINGINIKSSSHNKISHCNISSNIVNGIELFSGVDNLDVLEFAAAYGSCMEDPNYNPIYDFDDSGCINLIDLTYFTNYYGIPKSNHNIVSNCNITGNSNYGIKIFFTSYSNQIYHNNFIGNGGFIGGNAFDTGYTNIWDNGYPSGGNYWDNYFGSDLNYDGIGDTPYHIAGGDSQDNYPWINPNGCIPGIIIDYPKCVYPGEDFCVTIYVNSCSHTIKTSVINFTYPTSLSVQSFTYENLLGSSVLQIGVPNQGDSSGVINYGVSRTDGGADPEWGPLVTVCFSGGANSEVYELCCAAQLIDGSGASIPGELQKCVNVTVDESLPEIRNIGHHPSEQISGSWVNITCTVTDNIEVNNVTVELAPPTVPIQLIWLSSPMSNIPGTSLYYYNSTYFMTGDWYYRIMAEDYCGHQNFSTIHTFHIKPSVSSFAIPVYISPLSQTVSGGKNFTVNISIDPVVAISGGQFDIFFDPLLLTASSVEEGDLFSDYNTYFNPGVIDNINGTISNVYCVITNAGASTTSPGTLAGIHFSAKYSDGITNLNLSSVVVGRPDGTSAPVVIINGSVEITTYPPWDLNKDGRVNILDLIIIAQHWDETGTPCWVSADVNCDGLINILDMVLVGQHWTG